MVTEDSIFSCELSVLADQQTGNSRLVDSVTSSRLGVLVTSDQLAGT